MIITKIQGGLGNQLFQWAYGKSLAMKYKTDLSLDVSFYDNQYGNTYRNFELFNFPKLTNVNQHNVKQNCIEIIDDFNYKLFDYQKDNNYFLNGFWQSEKYFIDIKENIKEELSIDTETLEKLNKIAIGNCVSLHIRRTDYVVSNGFHPVLTMDYYNLALEIIKDYDNVLIFSDDIEWCKQNLSFKNMIFVENNTNIEDLWLMSLCKNNIIANSSFSWWGAWLNNNNDKKIIAPKKWFGINANLNCSDIVPTNWVKI